MRFKFSAAWSGYVEFEVEAEDEDAAYEIVYGEIPFDEGELDHIDVDLIEKPSPLEQLASAAEDVE